jgi:hypothetical protein
MIIESIIIGFSIVFGFWLMSKALVSIGEAFLKYLSSRDQDAKREHKN